MTDLPTDTTSPSPAFGVVRLSPIGRWVVGLGLLAASLFLYRGVFDGIRFCDDSFLVGEVSLGELLRYFKGDFLFGNTRLGGYFRPIVRVFLATESWAFGEWPPALHTVHFIVFLAAVATLWLLARRLFACERSASLAAALFLCYPTQPHAVYWLSSIGDLLAGLFVLLSLLFYATWRDRPRAATLGLCLGAAFMGFLSKELAATLPLLAVCLEIYLGRRGNEGLARRWLGCAGLFATLIVYLAWRRKAVGAATGFRSLSTSVTPTEMLERFDAFTHALINPAFLNRPAPWIGFGIMVVLVAGGLSWLARERGEGRRMALALAWSTIAILIYTPAGTPAIALTQWYFYLPSAFFCLWLCGALRALAGLGEKRRGAAGLAIALGVVITVWFAIANQKSMALWKEAEVASESFLTALAEAAPDDRPTTDSYLVVLSPQREASMLASPVSAYRRTIPMFLGVTLFDAVDDIYGGSERVPMSVFPPVTDDLEELKSLSYAIAADFDDVRRARPVMVEMWDLSLGDLQWSYASSPRSSDATRAEIALPLDLSSCHLTLIVELRTQGSGRIEAILDPGDGKPVLRPPPSPVIRLRTVTRHAMYLGYMDRCASATFALAGFAHAPKIDRMQLQIIELKTEESDAEPRLP